MRHQFLPAPVRQAIHHLRQGVKIAIDYHGQRSYTIRQEAFDLFRRFSPSVAVDIDGIWYFVSTADYGLSRIVFSQGSYEQENMAATFRLLDELVGAPVVRDRTFIDIGANIGTSSIPAVHTFGASDAISFEPEPRNYRLLRCNVIANDLESKIRTFPVGLSDVSRTAGLEWDGGSWGDHRIRLRDDLDDGPYQESSRPIVDVDLVRFDDMVSEVPIDLDLVGVVWMDVQGHEGYVLAGAKTLVERPIPLVIEYWPYGLRRADGLDLLHEVISSTYKQVIDVRRTMAEKRIVAIPTDEVEQLVEIYPAQEYTDLVLLH